VNNLGDLLRKAGLDGSATPEEKPAAAAPPAKDAANTWAAKVVVRTSRKGRGGKTVTLVSGASQPEAVARTLRKKLGVGVRAEGGDIVAQGDQVERITRWLGEQGVSRIVNG
jgi:translation initiation factor 1 (eIF-1/SUI1)